MRDKVKVKHAESGIRGRHKILGDVELMYELEQISGMWIVKDTEGKLHLAEEISFTEFIIGGDNYAMGSNR